MAAEIRISPRERAVLTAIIEMYIDTGEPVASQAIARQLGNRDGHEFGDDSQCDGFAGRCRPARSAAYFGGQGSGGEGISLLRRAVEWHGPHRNGLA